MDERDKKRRRMNTEGESVNRDHDNEKTDGAQIVATDIRPPKVITNGLTTIIIMNLDTSNSSDIADLSTEEFKIVRTKLTFVDKSEGIKRFFECPSSGVQITAPRRFGKSTFINMIEEFLMITVDEDAKPISNSESSDNYMMFMNLKLGQKHGDFVKKHCGQYPVISMSLKSVQGTAKTDVLYSLKIAICETFEKHSYLLEKVNGSRRFKNKEIEEEIETFLKYYESRRLEQLSEVDVTNALKFLSKILYTHFNKKVVILVDEADAPIMKAITENVEDENLKYLMRLLKEMLSAGLKSNRFLARSLVSSCVRLSGVYSWEINNQYHALFLQKRKFSETYGFTEQEVHNLLENAAFQAVNDFDGVKKWYNGYQTLNKDGAPIYSGWSVISYLSESIQEEKKMFDNYWAKSGLLEILKKLFVNHEIQKRIDKLIEDENISIVIAEPTVDNILKLKNTISFPSSKLEESQVDFFFQLLWDDGLLNAIEKNSKTVVLKIPNFEIKTEIQCKCYTQSLFEAKYKLKFENIERYIEALNQLLLTSSNEEESADEESNEEKGDATIPVNESELHHILFYLPYNNKLFTTQSSRPVVKVSEQLRDAKTSSQNKRREKHGRKNECDICVTRGTGGAILELKLLNQINANENSKAALQQIIDGKYHTLFDRDEYKHVRTKIYVGLCFKKNLDVTAHYLVDNIDINNAKIVCRHK
ncbi:uncharacterized protein LOC103313685 isoform X2 [Tribolium castaneum]|nr:PREDICTED: uncharacterized protein LOC103313685 isoform X1 [Tribolium castaneum]|eukprot:XP_015837647.1 PREDICTED: uncharacterized protein LOC103313685 isoform X1 [Tribolium castaneum]